MKALIAFFGTSFLFICVHCTLTRCCSGIPDTLGVASFLSGHQISCGHRKSARTPFRVLKYAMCCGAYLRANMRSVFSMSGVQNIVYGFIALWTVEF